MVFLWLKLDHSFSIGLPMVKLGSPIWKETAKKTVPLTIPLENIDLDHSYGKFGGWFTNALV